MNHISHLALYGLLAVVQARPEAGYSYHQPQSSFQLNQNQLNSGYQQQLQLSQSQQSSSYQQTQPQQLSQLSAPAVQYGVPNFQNSQPSQLNLQNQYLVPNLQISQNSVASSAQQSQSFFPNLGAQPSFNQISQTVLQQQVLPQITQDYSLEPQQLPLVTKHIYVHVAPEEPPAPGIRIISHPSTPRKNYKIIFIKAPRSSSSHQEVIHLPPQPQPVEEKTLVYVLVDRPQQPEIIVPTAAPIQPSKPEVYFIKYKAQKATAPEVSGIDFGSQQGLPIVEDLKKNQGLSINSGESTSSLFSGGLSQPSSKYGTPGYQKRSTNKEEP